MDDSDKPPQRGRTARRASRTRQRLLDAALDVFSHVGVDACSIENITERADVGKGTFYRHFVDKRAILLSLSESGFAALLDMVRATALQAKTMDEALSAILAAHEAFLTKYPSHASVLAQAQTLLSVRPESLAGLEAPFRAYYAAIEERLAPFLPAPVDRTRSRRLACAAAAAIPGFVFGASIGLEKEELPGAVETFSRAFRAGSGQWLA